MREHIIRLRGGWIWGPWLIRPFQAPPIDPRCESLGLRLDEVAGLVAVVLNGQELARPPSGTRALWLPLPRDPPLPRRNRLVLEVEPPRRPIGLSPNPGPWGAIALVVRFEGPVGPGHG
jgi:hypothetical protein